MSCYYHCVEINMLRNNNKKVNPLRSFTPRQLVHLKIVLLMALVNKNYLL